MEKKTLIGRYSELTRKIFSLKNLIQIEQDILNGLNIANIAKAHKVDYWVIHAIFEEFIVEKNKNNRQLSVTLGHKDQEYYTEEELLAGIDYNSYTWENLTEEEKQFYLNYGTENNNRADSSLE